MFIITVRCLLTGGFKSNMFLVDSVSFETYEKSFFFFSVKTIALFNALVLCIAKFNKAVLLFFVMLQ